MPTNWDQPEEREFISNIENNLRMWLARRRPDQDVESLLAMKPLVEAQMRLLEEAYADLPGHLDQMRADAASLFSEAENRRGDHAQ